ncbi:MAG: Hsp20/alpha crystallin family protein [Candidatus Lindowbacteria bacterium]|nr:Hsp20/alpha crystallin family protein [Candidatus Lindowbacteria bacterium]
MDKPENLLGDIKRARSEMEHLMRHVFSEALPMLRPFQGKWQPNVDVFECKDSIVVVAELAGVQREDISVTFDEGKLHLTGTRRDETPYKGRKYCQMEINYNEFERVIYLPENIDPDRITARLLNGLIFIEAPKKKPEEPQSRQVQIG